jgi:rSAM/selenodomain-associated transferase 1
MTAPQALAIYVKDPENDLVKTRLAASIGQEAARSVYRKLLAHTRSVTDQLTGADSYVCYANQLNAADGWQSDRYARVKQAGSGLGERMENTLTDLLGKGYQRVVLIGSDCPEINLQIMEQAFEALHHCDLVLGPANDGGYYLVGIRRLLPGIFGLPTWSHNRVLQMTLEIARAHQYSYTLLPALNDIDDLEDLQQYPDFLPK